MTNINHKYKATIDYLFKQLPMFQRVGNVAMKKDLGNIKKLCEVLDNPQQKFKSIHIAGTNGKGSTAHLISAILQSNGYKVGLYTSPHYKDFRERVKINGKLISKKVVVDFVEHNQASFKGINPSFFEWTVALAFDTFAAQKVDIAVIETGLGGRLDSTNIIKPEISVITNISYDHKQFLGDTLTQIAGEKAGIIKQEVPVVIGEYQKEVHRVFEEKAKKAEANIYIASNQIEINPAANKGNYTIYIDQKQFGGEFKFPMKGAFQISNLKTALLTLKILEDAQILNLDPVKTIRGIEGIYELTSFMGRWQILGQNPLIIGDSGHNEAGLNQILHELDQLTFKKLHFVLGVVKDKDLDDFLNRLPKDAVFYFCKANIPRGLEAKNLKSRALNFGLKGRSYISVRNAFKAAKRNAEKDDLVFIGGSIFVLAEVL